MLITGMDSQCAMLGDFDEEDEDLGFEERSYSIKRLKVLVRLEEQSREYYTVQAHGFIYSTFRLMQTFIFVPQ